MTTNDIFMKSQGEATTLVCVNKYFNIFKNNIRAYLVKNNMKLSAKNVP